MKMKIWEKIVKRAAVFAMAFMLCVPVTARICQAGAIYEVRVDTSYLALRTAAAYDSRNEIGELYTGDTVELIDSSGDTYWYVYSPKYASYGYVNKNFLTAQPSFSSWTVSVSKGYLALRTEKEYDAKNEIAQLQNGETVEVQSMDSGEYWYVYSPKHDQYGYVNKNYLIAPDSYDAGGTLWEVKVKKGYLALRTEQEYDEDNEIGELYTGDTVEVQSSGSGKYWYVFSSKYGRYGYVDKNYLVALNTAQEVKSNTSDPSARTEKQELKKDETDASDPSVWTVQLPTGYLALRTAKKADKENEIGRLYNGDIVQVQSMDSGDYWYVYAPQYKKYGYVDKSALVH